MILLAVCMAFLVINGFELNKNIPRGFNKLIKYTCPPIRSDFSTKVEYIMLGHNINRQFNQKTDTLPCGKTTKEICKYLWFQQKKISVCKQYRLDGLVWGTYKKLSGFFQCKRKECNVYPYKRFIDESFSQYSKAWKTLNPWLVQDSWLFHHLPETWPAIPSINKSIQVHGPISSQLWGSVLNVQLTEIVRCSYLVSKNGLPQIIKKVVLLPARSSFGGELIKIKSSNNP